MKKEVDTTFTMRLNPERMCLDEKVVRILNGIRAGDKARFVKEAIIFYAANEEKNSINNEDIILEEKIRKIVCQVIGEHQEVKGEKKIISPTELYPSLPDTPMPDPNEDAILDSLEEDMGGGSDITADLLDFYG